MENHQQSQNGPSPFSAWKATPELRNIELLLAELKLRKEKDVRTGKTNA
jgi:hypothetical protein